MVTLNQFVNSVFRCIYVLIFHLLNQARHPTLFEGKSSHLFIKASGSILKFISSVRTKGSNFSSKHNPKRATRPRIQVPPTTMLCAPSPIRLHFSGCPILEQTAGWDSQRIVGEIFKGAPGCPLAVPVSRSTHLTLLLPQPIPSAHIDPRKNSP